MTHLVYVLVYFKVPKSISGAFVLIPYYPDILHGDVVIKMRKLLLVVILLGGVGLLAMVTLRSGQGALEVQVAHATQAPLADTLLASGSLTYVEQIQLRPEVSGRVAEVLVEEGERVEAGQLLMSLDQVSFIAQQESAQAGVRSARLAVERLRAVDANLRTQIARQQQLLERRLVSRDGFDHLRSQQAVSALQIEEAEQALAQQLAALNQANEQLRRSQFRAPIAGQVVSGNGDCRDHQHHRFGLDDTGRYPRAAGGAARG